MIKMCWFIWSWKKKGTLKILELRRACEPVAAAAGSAGQAETADSKHISWTGDDPNTRASPQSQSAILGRMNAKLPRTSRTPGLPKHKRIIAEGLNPSAAGWLPNNIRAKHIWGGHVYLSSSSNIDSILWPVTHWLEKKSIIPFRKHNCIDPVSGILHSQLNRLHASCLFHQISAALLYTLRLTWHTHITHLYKASI